MHLGAPPFTHSSPARPGISQTTRRTRTEYLGKVNDMGFDGIELGFDAFGGFEATKENAREFQATLKDSGVPCVAIRAGGGLCQPKTAPESRARLEKAVQIAGWIGVGIVNTALATAPRDPTLDTGPSGQPSSHGSSALATEEDFIRTAGRAARGRCPGRRSRCGHYRRSTPALNRRQLLVDTSPAGAYR